MKEMTVKKKIETTRNPSASRNTGKVKTAIHYGADAVYIGGMHMV